MNEKNYWQARRVTLLHSHFDFYCVPAHDSPLAHFSGWLTIHSNFPPCNLPINCVLQAACDWIRHGTWYALHRVGNNHFSECRLRSYSHLVDTSADSDTLIASTYTAILISRLLHRWLPNCWIPAIHAYICDVTH